MLKHKGAHGFSNMEMSLCMYLCMTHTVLLGIKINVVQDELRRFLRVLRLFDKIGAENFISGVWNRIFKDKENKINNLLESDKSGLLLRPLSLSTNRKDMCNYITPAAKEWKPRVKFGFNIIGRCVEVQSAHGSHIVPCCQGILLQKTQQNA